MMKYVIDILERQKSFLEIAKNMTNKDDVDVYLKEIEITLKLLNIWNHGLLDYEVYTYCNKK